MRAPLFLVWVLGVAPGDVPAGASRAADAQHLLFPAGDGAAACERCSASEEPSGRIRCLIAARYRGDPVAAKVAEELFQRTGTIAGLLPEQDFDGGFRGVIRLVPDVPVAAKRKHLEWVAAALFDFEEVFGRLAADAGAPSFSYRWRSLDLGFFRSVGRRTPAAWVDDWNVNYNTNGTLNWGPDVVRELLSHEVFHSNDHAHRDWSRSALTPVYRAIVDRCGTDIKCLEPWAPLETKMRGTYYAFLPANGVGEYAAELAARFYREQRTILRGRRVTNRFKCRTPENARAWALLVGEFYGGADLVPPCR
jgi:hypothetical protein